MATINNNNERKRSKILFDFESIIDTKLSAVRKHLIEKNQYPVQGFEMSSYKFDRMFSTEDIMKDIEISDEDFLHPEYPIFTSMGVLLNTYLKMENGIINPKVLCKDAIQQRIIKETFPKANILVGSRKQVKTIHFARIVIGDIKHILEFNNPITVDFMLLNYRENFMLEDDAILNIDVITAVGDVNRFTIVKAYPEIDDPVG